MIHSVDSWKLLVEVSQQAMRNNRVIDCLLQVYIATEETKFGLDREELYRLLTFLKQEPLPGIRIRGLMGMASFSEDINLIRREFRSLKSIFDSVRIEFFSKDPGFNELSIGMSSDYMIAAGEGSTMVRIGTKIFGSR
jgi:pyridoxal phosphate enzyme (YggS family)